MRNMSSPIQIARARRTIACCFVLVFPALLTTAFAQTSTDISVGSVSLTIPNPNGFSPVTQRMTELFDFQKQFVASPNEEFVTFIPERDVREALKGNIPNLPRRFSVQTAKGLIARSVPPPEFLKLKTILKSQNDEILKDIERELPSDMKKLNEGLATNYDMDRAMSVSQLLPMPVHEDTERTLAYSALVKGNVNDATGNPTSFVSAFTVTAVHVKGKILFLYSYADKSGLEWSRTASKRWADAVLAANPSALQAPAKQSLSSDVSRLDWGTVGANAVTGAIFGMVAALLIGMVAGLLGWASKHRKAS